MADPVQGALVQATGTGKTTSEIAPGAAGQVLEQGATSTTKTWKYPSPAVPFFNDTGSLIPKGTPVNAAGVNAVNGVVEGIVADAASPALSSSVIGLTTQDVPDQEVGFASKNPLITDFDTSGLVAGGPSYLAVDGGITSTRPVFPNAIIVVGTAITINASLGIFQGDVDSFSRGFASKSYTFTSQGIASGQFWKAGFYDWSATDANITEAGATITYGTAGQSRAAHPGVVVGGPGTVVGGGVVELRVTGTLDSDTGTQTAAQTQTIIADITAVSANEYYEAVGKFSGQVTFELNVVSGTPTSYSLDFNYGFSKYEDFQNRKVTVTGFEAVWRGGAADTSFDVALLHHKTTGWTYAATGFVPGNGDIVRKSVDQAIDGNVASGVEGAYKRTGINTLIDSGNLEGVIIEIDTGANSTIQSMDLHVAAVSEELAL